MIKRTLHIGNAVALNQKNKQLQVTYPPKSPGDSPEIKTVPIEDIGMLVLDDPRITVSHTLIGALLANNAALISCDEKHMPTGMMLNLKGHSEQSEVFRKQIEASKPLKKRLWAQTVTQKILNQAGLLERRQKPNDVLIVLAQDIGSGDPNNVEGRAAAYYWEHLFGAKSDFKRDRYGEAPNNLLNYGYAILRATIARALVGSGLLPTLGIHHRNKYNAYCLADDIMEPYRPYVDSLVCDILDDTEADIDTLTPVLKQRLLRIQQVDVQIKGQFSPIGVAASRTSASLVKCYMKAQKKIHYPEWHG